MNERIYKIFEGLLEFVTNNYHILNHNISIKQIAKSLKTIYIDSDTFKYVLERCYWDNRNPFTTAYSEFMSNLHLMNLNKLFDYISEMILTRKLKETRTGNLYIVF
jgi:hypothetical protein